MRMLLNVCYVYRLFVTLLIEIWIGRTQLELVSIHWPNIGESIILVRGDIS
jgi:hypothetical protein